MEFMKSKKYLIMSSVVFLIFFLVMGFNTDRFPLITWILLAVLLETSVQVIGRIIFSKKDEE